jgi:hypothetical protein
LLAVLRNDPLPPKIRALNFGLFEGDGECRLYVTGKTTTARRIRTGQEVTAGILEVTRPLTLFQKYMGRYERPEPSRGWLLRQ